MSERDLEYELLRRAIAGDRASLSQLLLIHHDALRRHISLESVGEQLGVMHADDVLQQTFVRAAKGITKFQEREVGSMRGWLKTIASNVIRDAKKRRGRERRTAEARPYSDDGSLLNAVERLSCDQTPPIKRVQRSESIRRMHVAMASLPAEQRDIVERYYLQSQTLEEIAISTGRTIGSIRGICYRARKTLRELMGRSSLYFSN
ncbi:MAG: sigma-70 family RNA polymerase sigma factor [Planctomycetaceae bacterium]|nr:sigma-70 family RNA polymerase sigma factor [Planctomycetales bacterium]MCB9923807.1 sigma-70 family RNA polymerase sigma factor [Planctomycetaceae bacterium]